jgi:hypothetical protein
LLPAPDRFTGTPVDGWPRAAIHGLRRALLTKIREQPTATDDELVAFSAAWLRANLAEDNHRKGKKGKPKTGSTLANRVSKRHVQALLALPSPRRKPSAGPGKVDRSPRPTTLSGEELAAVVRSNLRARSGKAPAARKKEAKSTTTPRGSKALAKRTAKPRAAKPAVPRPSHSRAPLARVQLEAGASPRGPYVMWPAKVLAATRVAVEVRDLKHGRVTRLRCPLAARYAILQVSLEGFEVTARFITSEGKTVAEGSTQYRAGS